LILLGMNYKSDSLPAVSASTACYFDFSPQFLALTSFDGSVGSSNIQAKGRMDNYLQWWLKDSTLVAVSTDRQQVRPERIDGAIHAEDTAAAAADTTSLSVIEVPGTSTSA
jgi:hypothetical protein